MSVPAAVRRPDDRRVRLLVAIDDGAHRGRGDKWNVHEGDERRRDTGTVDNAQTRNQGRKLTTGIAGVLDETRREAALRKALHHDIHLVPEHNDDVVYARVEQRPDDVRQEGIVAHRQIRLETAHPRRCAGREDDGRNHPRIIRC